MARNDGLLVEQSFNTTPTKSGERKEFIAWDGEGYQVGEGEAQPFVLWGNSKGEKIIGPSSGLHTKECFDLLLFSRQIHGDAIHIIYAGTYDTNQILRDLSWRKLDEIHCYNVCNWRGYRIEWFPGKWLKIKRYKDQLSVRLFDVFSFFQSSFLDACKKYLGENDPEYGRIQAGKDARDSFAFDQLEGFILPYWEGELRLLIRMANTLRQDLENAGIFLASWHGPGAVANEIFKRYNIRKVIDQRTPERVNDAAQYAYSAGRFEQFLCGQYRGTIYEYDINSAYPAAITRLPNLQKGYWEHVKRFEHGTFGVWNIDYDGRLDIRNLYIEPQPLFRRSRNGAISYPSRIQGWYWTPEATLIDPACINEGWIFREYDQSDRPFTFVRDIYQLRLEAKDEGFKRALKLALNSEYGKFAQRVGSRNGRLPTWHQLEWAGYITSHTRAQIYNAIALTGHMRNVISVETDAIFSTEALTLPVGNQLGEWKETKHDSICYLQSGLYFVETNGVVTAKYRGLDKDRTTGFPKGMDYRRILTGLEIMGRYGGDLPPFASTSTRYIGIGRALSTGSVWRSWQTDRRLVHVGGSGKRTHMISACPECQSESPEWSGQLHHCACTDPGGASYPHQLPWKIDYEGDRELDYEREVLRWDLTGS